MFLAPSPTWPLDPLLNAANGTHSTGMYSCLSDNSAEISSHNQHETQKWPEWFLSPVMFSKSFWGSLIKSCLQSNSTNGLCATILLRFLFTFTNRIFTHWFRTRPMNWFWCLLSPIAGVGSVATRTLEWKVKIHQHLLNQSWLNFKMCLLH